MDTVIVNARVISPGIDLPGAGIAVNAGRIVHVFPHGEPIPSADHVIDAAGQMVMPGFVDIHCHGRSGFDFCDGSTEGTTQIAADKLREGVTTLLPTTLTLDEPRLVKALEAVRRYTDSGAVGSRIPGVHLEGPFISEKFPGAQNPAYVRSPDMDEVRRLNAVYPVCKVSYAVEKDPSGVFVESLLSAGITPSCVHSAAGYAEFQHGYAHGLRNLSHFCNQMTPLHHRDIGLVGAGLLCKDVYLEMICDTLHLCADMIRLVFALKDVNRIQLITDAMRAAGMPDGSYTLGGLSVTVSHGAARLPESGALAGSTLTLNRALKNVYEITGLPLRELVRTTGWNQACALHLPGIGRIEAGYRADLVMLDENFEVTQVLTNGIARLRAGGRTAYN